MLEIKTNPAVTAIFSNYPDKVRSKMLALRELIIETAAELETVSFLEETLKWGEPSYIAKKGSAIRIDWKPKTPNQYAMYLQCTSKLIPTFKLIYHNIFEFEGSRAIIFQLEDGIAVKELKKCVAVALQYHKIKHLPTLGL